MEKSYIVYKITCSVTGKVYIGQVVNKTIQQRFKRHIKCAYDEKDAFGRRCHLARAIRKYGADKFSIEQIDEASSQAELNEKEKYWIKRYDSIRSGYNCAEGGEGGNTYAGMSDARLAEIKVKIGVANSGGHNGQSKAVKCKSVVTGEECRFDTLTSCLNFLGIKNKAVVMSRASGKTNALWRHEWMFAYAEDDYREFIDVSYDPSCRKGQKVLLKSNTESYTFNSLRKAAEFLHVDRKAILDGAKIKGYDITYISR